MNLFRPEAQKKEKIICYNTLHNVGKVQTEDSSSTFPPMFSVSARRKSPFCKNKNPGFYELYVEKSNRTDPDFYHRWRSEKKEQHQGFPRGPPP